MADGLCYINVCVCVCRKVDLELLNGTRPDVTAIYFSLSGNGTVTGNACRASKLADFVDPTVTLLSDGEVF